ncbi:7711_t:CDS:2, partial [Cetraspora pellucida]
MVKFIILATIIYLYIIYDINALINRTASTACIDETNKSQIIYIGGDKLFGDNFTAVFNIATQQWESSPGAIAPIGIQSYSATLLNNDSILYIGGQPGGDADTLSYPLLDKLAIYNINNDSWSVISTSGNIPPSRYDHGAVFV